MVRRVLPSLACALALLSGCVTGFPGLGYYQTREQARYPDTAALPNPPFPPTGLAMFEGHTGRILMWNDLIEGVLWADVVILGEQHDDAVGHAVQLAVVEFAFASDSYGAVSMEMLERDEQGTVDEYLAGAIDAEVFTERTESKSWGGADGWRQWYLPIIDEAKRWDAPVIAANAPREYVRMARLEGWDALRALPPDQQQYFSLPRRPSSLGPQIRFAEFMRESWARHAAESAEPSQPPSDESIAAAWRSQSLWDATMADSITRELGPPWNRRRIIHLVGQFHSDFGGGLVQQIRARDQFAKILTVSLRPRNDLSLNPEDVGAADVVVYTGGKQEEEEESETLGKDLRLGSVGILGAAVAPAARASGSLSVGLGGGKTHPDSRTGRMLVHGGGWLFPPTEKGFEVVRRASRRSRQ